MDVLTNKRLFWLVQNVFHSVRSLMDKATHFGCADFKFETWCRCCPVFVFSRYFKKTTLIGSHFTGTNIS